MEITRTSLDTTRGSADWFTGDVYLDPVAAAPRGQGRGYHDTMKPALGQVAIDLIATGPGFIDKVQFVTRMFDFADDLV